jgi:hypothetical protein
MEKQLLAVLKISMIKSMKNYFDSGGHRIRIHDTINYPEKGYIEGQYLKTKTKLKVTVNLSIKCLLVDALAKG